MLIESTIDREEVTMRRFTIADLKADPDRVLAAASGPGALVVTPAGAQYVLTGDRRDTVAGPRPGRRRVARRASDLPDEDLEAMMAAVEAMPEDDVDAA